MSFILATIAACFIIFMDYNENYYHVKIFFGIIFLLFALLSLSFMLVDLVKIYKYKIPKFIFMGNDLPVLQDNLYSRTKKNLNSSCINYINKSNNYLLSENFHSSQNFFINNFNAIKNNNFLENNSDNKISLNHSNGSTKKLNIENKKVNNRFSGSSNNLNYNNAEKIQICPIAKSINNLDPKADSSITKSLNNFLSFNEYFLHRDATEIFEAKCDFIIKTNLRILKILRNSNVINSLNDIDFQTMFLNKIEEIENDQESSESRSKSTLNAFKAFRKNSYLNILNVEFEENKNKNKMNDKEKEANKNFNNLHLVDSEISRQDTFNVIVEKEESKIKMKNNLINGMIDYNTHDSNYSYGSNSPYQNFNNKFNFRKESLEDAKASENDSKEHYKISKKNSLSRNEENNTKKFSKKSLTKFSDDISSTLKLRNKNTNYNSKMTLPNAIDNNIPTDYREFIINEKPILNTNSLIKQGNFKSDKSDMIANHNSSNKFGNVHKNLAKEIKNVKRRLSRIYNDTKDDLSNLSQFNSNNTRPENLFAGYKMTRKNSSKKHVNKLKIKSSSSLRYGDLANNGHKLSEFKRRKSVIDNSNNSPNTNAMYSANHYIEDNTNLNWDNPHNPAQGSINSNIANNIKLKSTTKLNIFNNNLESSSVNSKHKEKSDEKKSKLNPHGKITEQIKKNLNSNTLILKSNNMNSIISKKSNEQEKFKDTYSHGETTLHKKQSSKKDTVISLIIPSAIKFGNKIDKEVENFERDNKTILNNTKSKYFNSIIMNNDNGKDLINNNKISSNFEYVNSEINDYKNKKKEMIVLENKHEKEHIKHINHNNEFNENDFKSYESSFSNSLDKKNRIYENIISSNSDSSADD